MKNIIAILCLCATMAMAETQTNIHAAVVVSTRTNAWFMAGKVLQSSDGLILLKGGKISYADEQRNHQLKLKREQLDIEYHKTHDLMLQMKINRKQIELLQQWVIPEGDDTYCVYGIDRIADDEEWKGHVWYAGLYEYTSVLGANRKVRAYATSPQLADKMFK